jgi:crossover junction endodeoxyribonuclease RuvC
MIFFWCFVPKLDVALLLCIMQKDFDKKPTEKIILGVDPGTRIAGYGLIKIVGQNIELLQYGVLKLDKYSNHELKLKKIFDRLTQLIDEYLPDEMAIEDPFYGKNAQSMLKLGRAQGVAMAAALARNIPIVEYSPKTIKLSVTGSGGASKEQVAYMVESILKVKMPAQYLDATDAVAIAICHHYHANALPRSSKTTSKTKKGSWGAFLSENPERLK